MNVLIVEDNAAWAQLAATLLAPVARKVRIAKTYAEAHKTIEMPNGFDVVMLDLSLPDSTVAETVSRIPMIVGTGRKVVVMTGCTIPAEMIDRARENGATEVLFKGDIHFADKLRIACRR